MKFLGVFLGIFFFAGASRHHEATATIPRELLNEAMMSSHGNRPMCEVVPSRASICREEVIRIDQDFAYKWPVLYFYLDQRPENRSLILIYISKLRDQLAVVEYECSERRRLQNTIYAIDAQLALMELRLHGKTIEPALESRAHDEREIFLFGIVRI